MGKHIVQIRKKAEGPWLEVAQVDDKGAAETVGNSFLKAKGAQEYRVLDLVAQKARAEK
jgi:hypothetical protein